MTEATLILQVETPDGVFLRRIMPASVLPTDVTQGDAAEDATRNAAAIWGLPDFVFRPSLKRHGSGTRELGDAILIVGDRAACIQVKARAVPSSDDARERSWLDKKIAQGTRQAAGTIRSMRHAERTVLINQRGQSVSFRGCDKSWISVVVLDHPGIEGYVPDTSSVVLLRRDWEFLFSQLKSTYAVLEYLERIGRTTEHVALGDESIRYYQLAQADAAAPPEDIDPRLLTGGGRTVSFPLLPLEPAENGEIIRIMLEDIAAVGAATGNDAAGLLDVLAAIDAAPVAYRAGLGADIMRWLRDLADGRDDELRWWFRRHNSPDRPHLVVGAASRQFDPLVQDAFSSYVQLRHQQRLELVPEHPDLMTVGILVTPRHNGRRPWDTTMCATRGDQGFDPTERAALEQLWGPIGANLLHRDSDAVTETPGRAEEPDS